MWSNIDGSFDMLEMYWNIVGVFDGSEQSNELLRWWNTYVIHLSCMIIRLNESMAT